MVKYEDRDRGYYKARKVGFGLSVSIPRVFAKLNGIEDGSLLKLIWNGRTLTVTPVIEEEPKETT